MTTKKIVWVARCDDVFNGYGLIAVGKTEKVAEAALYAKYREVSKRWNKDGVYCKSIDSLMSEWGIITQAYEIGKGYFGDEGAEDD